MIPDHRTAGSIFEFKDRDIKTLSLEERVAFSKSNDFPEPGVSVLELLALNKALEASGNKPIRILETGMCFGTTTRFFLTHIAKYGGELHTVECQIRPLFKKVMEDMKLWDKIIVHNEDTREMYWDPKLRIDFLFIDSEHALSDALGEYMRFRHFINAEAIIGFHDSECCVGVKRAIEMINEVDKLELVSINDCKADAGIAFFRLIEKNRQDNAWNTRSRK